MVGDIIYVKKCLGEDGRPIDIYKFRTMDRDADQRHVELVDGFDSHGHPLSDPRITPMGKFLRRYWIDELPQFYNLARGDIKPVGIRPQTEKEWLRYPPAIMERALQQKPGLMGVQYAHHTTPNFESHIRHLEEYLNSWDVDPLKTDQDYLWRIVRSIILGGIRSS